MTFMVNLGYTPGWLSFDGTRTGVPMDWSIWTSIVTILCTKLKIYSQVKYIEIWNEPDGGFLT